MRAYLDDLLRRRSVAAFRPILAAVTAAGPTAALCSDEHIRSRIAEIRAAVASAAPASEPSESELRTPVLAERARLRKERLAADMLVREKALAEHLPEVFALTREAATRTLGMRHFDVQVLAAIALNRGGIAEMATGEGKTLAATLTASLRGLSGLGVHIVTVNDYLARRDAAWMGAIYHALGLSVGVLQGHSEAYRYDPSSRDEVGGISGLRACSRREAYEAEITYGTNVHFGFDYLRDNMAATKAGRVQRGHEYAIVDEVDSILIDEAKTPLLISGLADADDELFLAFDRVVRALRPCPTPEVHVIREETKALREAHECGDYYVDIKDRKVAPTEAGIARVEQLLGIPQLYDGDPRWPHHLHIALTAHALKRRDVDYLVREDGVVIVDEFTGRTLEGRRWGEGTHEAVEAKEGVFIRHEPLTRARITLQNYVRLYGRLAGMTGTAATSADEFADIYGLDVYTIPTNRPLARVDEPDLVYQSARAKLAAVVEDVVTCVAAGRPVLIGTTSVVASEELSKLLDARQISHRVLNARQDAAEASIIANAGRPSAVTVATNMAGRGTDILLGGNATILASEQLRARRVDPASASEAEWMLALAEANERVEIDRLRVLAAGGLHVIGTARHEARRIDNQLRGRAGRQGDPGSSRFYLSLDDEILARFAGDKMRAFLERTVGDPAAPIGSAFLSRAIEMAQATAEHGAEEVRKQIVEYDDVISTQRELVYAQRNRILDGDSNLAATLQLAYATVTDKILDDHPDVASPDPDLSWSACESIAGAVNRLGVPVSADEVAAISPAGLPAFLRERTGQTLIAFGERFADRQHQVVDLLARSALNAIDSVWVQHLTELERSLRGMGVRGYGAQSPVAIFAKEAGQLYDEFASIVQREIVRAFIAATVQPQTQTAA